MNKSKIIKQLPQGKDFIFVDKVIDINLENIKTEYTFIMDHIIQNHFPGDPVVPGILLQEMVFQSGILLIQHRLLDQGKKFNDADILLREVKGAKFFKKAKPLEKLSVQLKLEKEKFNLFHMRADILNNTESIVCRIDFTGLIQEKNK